MMFSAFLPAGQAGAKAQSSPSQQWEILHENDFLTFTDRYYSAGSFIGYTKRFESGLFQKSSNRKEQLRFGIGQETYTPTKIKSRDTADFDRPYAGYLSGYARWTSASISDLFLVQVDVGITGGASGAQGFQQWYHRAIVTSAEAPEWVAQIPNAFHTNLMIQYIKEWRLSENPFSVTAVLSPTGVLGTRDMYVQPEVAIHFGRRNALQNSIAFDQIGTTTKEIFFGLRAGYRQVFYDALLEGSRNGDAPFTVTPESGFLYGAFDFKHRFERNDYKVSFIHTTKRTALADGHSYLSLSYARQF
ncbi:DUF2219 family protein [Dokdonia sinensis]|uniref:DUF2219 family protein n=2 Tax=Dokdonia sinensis TaxID=2479847 RepID=A0A3M0G601_9FLAO|nr:DUF2219 family protein [Dokdonia sinensis]